MFNVRGSYSAGGAFVLGVPSDSGPAKVTDLDMSWTDNAGKNGIITIEGVAPGECQLYLLDGGRQLDAITIKVVPCRRVVTRFYNMIDGVGHTGISDPASDPNFSLGELSALIDGVNQIVFAQSYVLMAASGSGVLKDANFAPHNFGDHIDKDDRSLRTIIPFADDPDPDAAYHVFFVWSIKEDATSRERTLGATVPEFTLILSDLDKTQRILTLSHEFVHWLSDTSGTSHDAKQSDLMFKTEPHGIMMRRDRLLRIIHT
jgi:hypothetical protein